MKKIILAIIAFTFLLLGCSDASDSASTTTNEIQLTEFKDRDLKSPNSILNSIDEVSYLIDYISFYKIEDPVVVKISEGYKKSIKSIKLELNNAKNKSLIGDVYHIDFDINNYTRTSTITLTAFIHDYAIEVSEGNSEAVLLKSFNRLENDTPLNNSYYLEKHNNGSIHVEGSMELYYAIINGYLPICKENSPADLIYKEMLKVLGRIYSPVNSDYQNLKAIYEYLTNDIKYDRVASKSSDFDLEKNQAYFLEGVFLNRLAVCDGKSKAYAVLCNYVGIKNVRIRASNDNLALHAYNYVLLDDKWYLSCPTYGASVVKIDDINYQIPSYNMFLTTLKTPYSWTYESIMHKDIEALISDKEYPYYEGEGLYLNSYEEIEALVLRAVEDEGALISIEIMSNLNTDEILEVCSRLEEKLQGQRVEAILNRSISNNVYSILII